MNINQNTPSFEDIKLAKKMRDLRLEIESVNQSEDEFTDEYLESLEARKAQLLQEHYKRNRSKIKLVN